MLLKEEFSKPHKKTNDFSQTIPLYLFSMCFSFFFLPFIVRRRKHFCLLYI